MIVPSSRYGRLVCIPSAHRSMISTTCFMFDTTKENPSLFKRIIQKRTDLSMSVEGILFREGWGEHQTPRRRVRRGRWPGRAHEERETISPKAEAEPSVIYPVSLHMFETAGSMAPIPCFHPKIFFLRGSPTFPAQRSTIETTYKESQCGILPQPPLSPPANC